MIHIQNSMLKITFLFLLLIVDEIKIHFLVFLFVNGYNGTNNDILFIFDNYLN